MNKYRRQTLLFILINVSFISLFGYYLFLRSPLAHIKQLQQSKVNLTAQKIYFQSQRLPKEQDLDLDQFKQMKSDWFADLFVVLEFFQIKVKSLRVNAVAPHLQQEGVMLQLDLQGPYSSLQPFFAVLLNQGKRALILDYDYQTKNGLEYRLALNLFMLRGGPSLQSQPEGASLNEQANPFCWYGRPHAPALFNKPVPLLSLDQLKLVGYLQQGLRVEAFLQTKEGNLIGVHVGESLGAGTVISISPEQVLLRIPPQSSLIITS